MIFFNAITRAWMLLWLAPVMALQAAAPPTLLKDIGQVTNPYSSDPREYTALGSSGMVVFTARLSDNTSAVCRTDGTPGGTEVLVVFPDYPVHSTSRLGETAALGNEAIFTRRGDNDRWELWKTDGTTAGTTRFALFPGANANGFRGLPSELVSLPGQVIMKAYTPETGEELWTTDGTAEGTFLLRDINPGPLPMPFGYDDKYHRGLAACGGLVYFAAHDDLSGTEVWKTDGTTAGTTLVKDIMPGPAGSSPSGFAFSGGLTYFTATGTATTGNPPQTTPSRDLWRTDGTGEGTVRLRQFRSNDRVSGFFFTGTTTVFVRAHLYNYLGPGSFQEIDGAFLQTDGSPAGTIPFGTISERAFSPHSILAILPDGRFIFESRGIGFFPNHTGRISLFDRGQACTLLEGDLLASAFHDGQFYAMLSPAYGPDAFWKYNPAAAAGQAITRMGNPATQTLQSTGGLLIANNNGPASDPSGVEPWIVHPDSGPALLADLYPGSITESYPAGPDLGYNSNSNADVPENLGGTLVFPAYSTSGVELWRSDGTTAGTTVLRDIIPGPEGHYHIIIHTDAPYLAIGPRSGQLLFFERWAQGIAEPREIWITDGTTAGTVKVHEEHPASGSPLLPWQRGVWWLNNISSNRNALWLSDGTPSGTRAVKEITHYFGQDKPSANFDGTTYAILTNSQKAVSLWEIHPDPARVRLLYDFKKPGDAAVNIRAMPVFQGALWFFVQRITGTTGTAEIWRMSPGGTPEWLLTLPAGIRVRFWQNSGRNQPDLFQRHRRQCGTRPCALGHGWHCIRHPPCHASQFEPDYQCEKTGSGRLLGPALYGSSRRRCRHGTLDL